MMKRNNFLIIISISLISAALVAVYKTDKKIINLFNKQNLTKTKKPSLKAPKEEVWITVLIHGMLSQRLPNNFIGNIEGSGIYRGECDCIICDGFVGNVVLKVSESLAESARTLIKEEIRKSPLAILGALLMKPSLKAVRKRSDYAEYGGAPLLGVNGIVMICHGRSSAKAIKNAIRAACREIEHNILETMKKEISG